MELRSTVPVFGCLLTAEGNNPVAEADSKGLVNSPAFTASHTCGLSGGLSCLCFRLQSRRAQKHWWGALSLLVARNSNSLYLRKLEGALGNNGTDISAMCHVAKLQEPRKRQRQSPVGLGD